MKKTKSTNTKKTTPDELAELHERLEDDALLWKANNASAYEGEEHVAEDLEWARDLPPEHITAMSAWVWKWDSPIYRD